MDVKLGILYELTSCVFCVPLGTTAITRLRRKGVYIVYFPRKGVCAPRVYEVCTFFW